MSKQDMDKYKDITPACTAATSLLDGLPKGIFAAEWLQEWCDAVESGLKTVAVIFVAFHLKAKVPNIKGLQPMRDAADSLMNELKSSQYREAWNILPEHVNTGIAALREFV